MSQSAFKTIHMWACFSLPVPVGMAAGRKEKKEKKPLYYVQTRQRLCKIVVPIVIVIYVLLMALLYLRSRWWPSECCVNRSLQTLCGNQWDSNIALYLYIGNFKQQIDWMHCFGYWVACTYASLNVYMYCWNRNRWLVYRHGLMHKTRGALASKVNRQ